jgi:hypothetical protein
MSHCIECADDLERFPSVSDVKLGSALTESGSKKLQGIADFLRALDGVLSEQHTRIELLEEAAKDALAHLVAATSLLDRGGKKAAASDKIFDQMLIDYNGSINRVRSILTHEAHK